MLGLTLKVEQGDSSDRGSPGCSAWLKQPLDSPSAGLLTIFGATASWPSSPLAGVKAKLGHSAAVSYRSRRCNLRGMMHDGLWTEGDLCFRGSE
ncbi:hypothetical protein L7F22_010282 [Adiantum nelumboides]|nr:hypothetical protein [Adiantum nelumboides]